MRADASPCDRRHDRHSSCAVRGDCSFFIFGFITLGLGWSLYALLWPATVIWAIVYYGLTFGSAASATIGMRVMDIEMRTWYGAPAYFVLGAVHAVVFWITCRS